MFNKKFIKYFSIVLFILLVVLAAGLLLTSIVYLFKTSGADSPDKQDVLYLAVARRYLIASGSVLLGACIIHMVFCFMYLHIENLERINETVLKVRSEIEAGGLREFKELLDKGIINQEEFDQKKKQILG